MHSVSFDCDTEIAVFQTKNDASERLSERVKISNSQGWVISNEKVMENDEVVEMVHDTYTWRKVYRITKKNLY